MAQIILSSYMVQRFNVARECTLYAILRCSLWIIILIQLACARNAQPNIMPTPFKPILRAQIPVDNESMFRLPNQSSVCSSFVNSFYLDWSAFTGEADGVPVTSRLSTVAESSRNSPSWPSSQASAAGRVGLAPPPPAPASSPRISRPGYSSYDQPATGNVQRIDGYFENGSRGPGATLYTFTTPNYPANYPPHIDCIKIIRAPSKTDRIVLDFRGPIVFEPSENCDNDYLEIRDGQYGFSPLVGKFCTDSWRLRPIVSSGPWLWLRIQTDYTIEKSGFQAVYYFEPNRQEVNSLLSNYFHKIESVIRVDAGTVLTRSNLTQLMQTYAQTLEKRSTVVSGVREFIFDIRAADEDMVLRIHLETIKFPIEEAECYHNMIEIYGHFFLSDRPKSRAARKTYSRTQTPPDTRVIRACNVASRSPVLYRLGRAVVRLVATSSVAAMQAADQLEETPKHHHLPSRDNTDLPELKLLATALTLAPCRPSWFPCMRVADLLQMEQQLNATGDYSVVDILMQPEDQQFSVSPTKSPSNTIDAQKRGTRRQKLVGDNVYCVAISRLCNQYSDCPNGEDEDDCPRARDSLVDLLKYYAEQTTTQIDNTASTTTPTASQSKKEREEEDEDEFHHHPSIIIGLLGFCAICGLLSAGMTLVNRGKQSKQRSFTNLCNRVLFRSNASLLTTLEDGSASRLNIHESKMPNPSQTPMQTETRINSDGGEVESDNGQREFRCSVRDKYCARTERCFNRGCPVRKKRPISEPLPATSLDVSTRVNATESAEREQKQSCSSADLVEPSESVELASRNPVEVFDRTAVPFGYVSRDWDESPVDFLRSHDNLRRKVQSGDLLTRMPQNMTRANAASFGNLPNTIVCPVEKLSDVIYHCGMSSPESNLNRTHWNRSGPLPLVTESMSALASDYLHEAIHTTRSAKCLSRLSSTERRYSSSSSRMARRNPEERRPQQGMSHAWAGPAEDYAHGQTGMDNACYVNRFDAIMQKSGESGGGKRKTFKGGAPKRARYSIDPSTEPNQINNSVEVSLETSDYGDGSNRQGDNGNTAQTSLFWTSSCCSTSGELLNSGPSSREMPWSRREITAGTQSHSKPLYWGGPFFGTHRADRAMNADTPRGPSSTISEDASLVDLSASELTPKLIYHRETIPLGPGVDAAYDGGRSMPGNEDANEQLSTIGRITKPSDASFKVTMVPRVRGLGSGRADGTSPSMPSEPNWPVLCDCAVQSNELIYRVHHHTAQPQLAGQAAIQNVFARPTDDRFNHGRTMEEFDDSEGTATHNHSEETESGTYSDERPPSNFHLQQRETSAWQASDEQTISSEGSPVNAAKPSQVAMVGNSKRTTNSTTIIITSRDGTQQVYREEQL